MSVPADQDPEEASTAGRTADPLALEPRHAARDEAIDLALLVDRPDRRILRADKLENTIRDHLEDPVDGEDAGDRARRRVERVKPLEGDRRSSSDREACRARLMPG
jgi:hypothetical protein